MTNDEYDEEIRRIADMEEGPEQATAIEALRRASRVPIADIRRRIREEQAVDGGQGFNEHDPHAVVAQAMLRDMGGSAKVVYDRGEVWRPLPSGLWQAQSEDAMVRAVIDRCPPHLRNVKKLSDYKQIAKTIASICAQPGFFDQAREGVAAGGTFWFLEGGELKSEPLTMEHRQTLTLTVRAEAGEPVRWLRHLRDHLVEDDQIDRLQELSGLTIMGDLWRWKQAAALVGERDTGKTVVLTVLRGTMPPEWVTANPPANWHREYDKADLAGKRAVIAGDISSTDPMPDGHFKLVIGAGDPISGRQPFGRIFTFVPKVGVWIGCNKLPPTRDRTDAFFSRMCPLQFQNPVPAEEQVAGFPEQLLAEEGPQIVMWALEGARRAAANGVITSTRQHEGIMRAWVRQADSVTCFFEENNAYFPVGDSERYGQAAHGPEVHKAYVKWCHDHSLLPLSLQQFYAAIGEARFAKRGMRVGRSNGYTVIRGVVSLMGISTDEANRMRARRDADLRVVE